MKKKPQLEARLERQAVTHARKRGIDSIKLNLQGRRGWPDRLFLLPRGRPLFIELKRVGKKLRPDQERVHARLKPPGYKIFTIDDLDDFRRILKRALSLCAAV